MFGSKKNSIPFCRNLKEEEITSLAQLFQQKCKQKDLAIPPKVESELMSRINQAKKGEAKPKLSFNGNEMILCS